MKGRASARGLLSRSTKETMTMGNSGGSNGGIRGVLRMKVVRLLIAALLLWLAQYVTCRVMDGRRCVDPQTNCTPG
jgi:hypothetical protein